VIRSAGRGKLPMCVVRILMGTASLS
jgi:hypothetical protein